MFFPVLYIHCFRSLISQSLVRSYKRLLEIYEVMLPWLFKIGPDSIYNPCVVIVTVSLR